MSIGYTSTMDRHDILFKDVRSIVINKIRRKVDMIYKTHIKLVIITKRSLSSYLSKTNNATNVNVCIRKIIIFVLGATNGKEGVSIVAINA